MKVFTVIDANSTWEANRRFIAELLAFWLGLKSWFRLAPCKVHIIESMRTETASTSKE